MKNHITFKSSLVILALLGGATAHAATMSKDQHKVAKDRIEADYKTERKACDSQSGNAKDVCVEQAKAKEKVAKAELEATNSGKASDQTKLLKVKADTAYDVAKEMCDDKAGNDKDVCVKEAKAAREKALADAKMGDKVAEAKTDANQDKAKADAKLSDKVGEAKADANKDKRDADYKVAVEKCDALAGDAKSSCVASAKTKFGKN